VQSTILRRWNAINIDWSIYSVVQNLVGGASSLATLDLYRLQWSSLQHLIRSVAWILEIKLAVDFLICNLRNPMQVIGIQLGLPMVLKHILVPETHIFSRLCRKLLRLHILLAIAINLVLRINIVVVWWVLFVLNLYKLTLLLVVGGLCLQIEPSLVI
jgi:hypothetical protein